MQAHEVIQVERVETVQPSIFQSSLGFPGRHEFRFPGAPIKPVLFDTKQLLFLAVLIRTSQEGTVVIVLQA